MMDRIEPRRVVGKILSEFKPHGGPCDRDADGTPIMEDDYPEQTMRQKRTKLDLW